MHKVLVLTLLTALLFPASTDARDPDDFPKPPPLGWSKTDCKEMMKAREKAVLKEAKGWMKEVGRAPKPKAKKKKEAEIAGRLEEMQDEARVRITAQKKAAGKWGKKPVWATVKWAKKTFQVAGCLVNKPDLPLQTLRAIAQAPEKPTEADQDLLSEAETLIRVKKIRDKCWKLPVRIERVKCRQPHAKYRWLDRYKLK